MAAIGYWVIRDPWNTCVALDEFGAGTLNGYPPSGSSYDACGPAAIENVAANLEHRLPSYENIGHIRADMMGNGDWTEPSDINNPRTGGCTIADVAAEIPRRGYHVVQFDDYTDAVCTEFQIRAALMDEAASIFIVTNASALAGNEQNVHGHFVAIAGYGGDNADGSTGKLYILNSDVYGQHGTATGQWTPLSQFLAAEPHGFAVMSATPVAPPPPPLADDEPSEAAASQQVTVDLQQLQQLVDAAVAKALADVKPVAAGS